MSAAYAQPGQGLEELRKVIKDAFSLFQKADDTIDDQDVGVVMRYLGQFPSEEDLSNDLMSLQEAAADGRVSYDNFEKLMLQKLLDHAYDPTESEHLRSAFQVLDPDNKGYIEIELLRANLTNEAGGLKEREFSDFLEFAKDKETGDSGTKIYYEDYVVNCAALVDKHLNDLYRDARAPKKM
eukprot:gene823-869_t